MELVAMDFNGLINVGSTTPCSKHNFGMRLAESFGFNQSLISKGSIKQHPFSAKRSSKLDLDCQRHANLKVDIPAWERSIAMFAEMEKKN